jgi:hypothetical protein
MYAKTCNAVAIIDETGETGSDSEKATPDHLTWGPPTGSLNDRMLCQEVQINGSGVRCIGSLKNNHCSKGGSYKAFDVWHTKHSDEMASDGPVAASIAAILRSSSLFSVSGRIEVDVRRWCWCCEATQCHSGFGKCCAAINNSVKELHETCLSRPHSSRPNWRMQGLSECYMGSLCHCALTMGGGASSKTSSS